jgi:hypothetical protein
MRIKLICSEVVVLWTTMKNSLALVLREPLKNHFIQQSSEAWQRNEGVLK